MKGMCAADFFPFFSSVKSSKEVNQMLAFLSKNNNNLFTSCAYVKRFTLPISLTLGFTGLLPAPGLPCIAEK